MDGKRRAWGLIFLATGLLGMTAVLLVALGATEAMPVAIVLCVVAIYAGYRIWKAAHPATSVWRELSRRTVAVITFGVTAGATWLALAFPEVTLAIVGIYFAALFAFFTLLVIAERTSRER